MPSIFPDYPSPIVRTAPDRRSRTDASAMGDALSASVRERGCTNIRNTKSAHWRRWRAPANRCVVPWTSFCEYAETKPKKTPTWFAFDDERPLAFFAELWCSWRGIRGTKAHPIEGEHTLFGLTTDVVGAIHPRAMPVILTDPAEIKTWMSAPAEEALRLQRGQEGGHSRWGRLESRLGCPRCGSREVTVLFIPPTTNQIASGARWRHREPGSLFYGRRVSQPWPEMSTRKEMRRAFCVSALALVILMHSALTSRSLRMQLPKPIRALPSRSLSYLRSFR
jgi:putative SOS response-associated peptidase YedK